MDMKKSALSRRAQDFSQITLWPILLCLGVGTALLTPLPLAHADTDPAAQMLLGNPDKAKSSPSSTEHFLVKRGQYALSYNDKLRFPNWVAWHLTADDIGSTERGQFQPDPHLPSGFTHVVTRDYTSSGYDRGHNCPSKDRTASKADNDIVFYMSNITPQQHGMNAGPSSRPEVTDDSLRRRNPPWTSRNAHRSWSHAPGRMPNHTCPGYSNDSCIFGP